MSNSATNSATINADTDMRSCSFVSDTNKHVNIHVSSVYLKRIPLMVVETGTDLYHISFYQKDSKTYDTINSEEAKQLWIKQQQLSEAQFYILRLTQHPTNILIEIYVSSSFFSHVGAISYVNLGNLFKVNFTFLDGRSLSIMRSGCKENEDFQSTMDAMIKHWKKAVEDGSQNLLNFD